MRALVLVAIIGCATPASQTTVNHADVALSDDADPRAIDEFKWVLEPYGNWIEDREWGTIWVPAYVRKGFTPYATDGHWKGKEWTSDYPWGWVTFHYGRWVQSKRGWVWIPGRLYSPAWATWEADDRWVAIGPTPPRWRWVAGRAVPIVPPRSPKAWIPLSEIRSVR